MLDWVVTCQTGSNWGRIAETVVDLKSWWMKSQNIEITSKITVSVNEEPFLLTCIELLCVLTRIWPSSGDPEASGLSAPRQQPAAAVHHQMWGGRQVPAHLHSNEAAAGSGKDAAVCGDRWRMLPAQTVPGAVWYPRLRPQLWASNSVPVRAHLVFFMKSEIQSAVKWSSKCCSLPSPHQVSHHHPV